MDLVVEPPSCLQLPLKVPNFTLLGPGPTTCHPRVLHAMSLPVLSPLHTEFHQIMDEVKEGIQYVFQTKNPLTMVISASGNGGAEAAICNTAEQGEVVLIGINGMWSLRAADIAERYGTQVKKLEKDLGDVFTLAEVEEALKKYHPVLFFVVHGESSTGVMQPMEGLGDLCHKYNCLLVVDAVVSVGNVPVLTDKWKIDVIFSSSQKGLGCPAGLAPISYSQRALEKIKSRKTPVPARYFDALTLGDFWSCFGNKIRTYHHTNPTNLFFALREGLALIAEQGIQNIWARTAACHKQLVKGLKELGVGFFVKDESIMLPCVTVITYPGVNWELVNEYLLKKHNTEMSLGTGPTKGKVLRIGLLGYTTEPYIVDHILKTLKDALEYAKQKK
ncbi:alanine--glyoxylate aminotransferase [Anabrus simplex]|uniref:alanine--glyoxylate aminotransferase n=1 Tax=Anabrus simplex TaxID=316456 RepID=UPI0035A337C7